MEVRNLIRVAPSCVASTARAWNRQQ